MFSGSLRTRLLLIFTALFVVVGTGTLVTIERTLSSDLLATLDGRLTAQGKAVATWLEGAGHPERLAPRLAQVTRTRITVVGADGLVEGDSRDTTAVGRPIGEAPEISAARRGDVGRATRQLIAGAPPSYLVAVLTDEGRWCAWPCRSPTCTPPAAACATASSAAPSSASPARCSFRS